MGRTLEPDVLGVDLNPVTYQIRGLFELPCKIESPPSLVIARLSRHMADAL